MRRRLGVLAVLLLVVPAWPVFSQQDRSAAPARELTRSFRMTFVRIDPGALLPGSDSADEDEAPAHGVTLTEGFSIQGPDLPVEQGWEPVMQIAEGQRIQVKTRDGGTRHGTLMSATAESIAIRHESGARSIDRAEVLRVRVYDPGRRTRRGLKWTAIGAAAGAAIGFAACTSCLGEGAGPRYVGPGASVGMGLGALGFLSSPYRTVYEVK